MTLDDLHFLLSPEGTQWLQNLANDPITSHNHLQIATQLRKQLTAVQAQAVLETAILRQSAKSKFSRAAQMFFTRPALEQASSELIATYRAGRLADLAVRHIADLGCSIGGDALAFAEHARVTGVDWDPVRLAMAQENVRVYGRSDRFQPLQADLLELTPLRDVDALFFDPARRDDNGRRFYSVHQYRPPLSLIDNWRDVVPTTAVKISPGVNYDELPSDADVEFISVYGEVKEAVLWYGRFRSGIIRQATLLPGPHTITHQPDLERVPVTEPQAYLYEPDGAVIRAHLVQELAHQLGANQIDAEIAYLTGTTAVDTPFSRCFTIEDSFPFQLKRLRQYLRQRKIGSVTIKKRGSPLDPATLQQQLRLKGDNHRILFLTHVKGEPMVLIGEEIKKRAVEKINNSH